MIQTIFRFHEISKRRNFEPTKVRQSEISTDRAEARGEISCQECGVRFTKFTTAKSISRLGQAIYMKQNTSRAFPDLS